MLLVDSTYIVSALFTVTVHSQMFSLLLFEKHGVFVLVQKREHVSDIKTCYVYNPYKNCMYNQIEETLGLCISKKSELLKGKP